MRKTLSLMMLSLCLLAWTSVGAVVQTVKMTTSRAVGETLSFEVSAMTGVTVDWGDGEAVTYQDGTVTGVLKAQTITVTGDEFMTSLIVSGLDLTELNLNGATQLLTLDCSDNHLKSLPFSKITELRELDCSNNELEELLLTNTVQLRVLNCANNKLTSLALTRTTYLEQLICDNNQLSSLTLTNNSYLQSVWCANNAITALGVTRSSALQSVYCPDNQLTGIVINDASNLTDFWCENNQLTKLDLASTTQLYTFNADNNQLSTVALGGITSSKGPYLLSYVNNKLGLSSFYAAKGVTNYFYAPQDTLQFFADTVEVNVFLDFSEYLNSSTGTTIGTLNLYRTIDDSELARGLANTNDFYVRTSSVKFWKPQGEVYGVITCNQYPELRLVTTPFVAGVIPEGIGGIKADNNSGDGVFYDLQGRRVEQPKSGIYVKDGKKVFVK